MHIGKQGNAVACSCHKFKHSFDPKKESMVVVTYGGHGH